MRIRVPLILAWAAIGLTSCGTVGPPSTAVSAPSEILEIQFNVDAGIATGAAGAEATFELITPGADEPETVRRHDLGVQRATFDIDVTEAIALDLRIDGELAVPMTRAYWEADVDAEITIKVQRGGVMLRREIPGPEGCREVESERRRCRTRADKQFIPMPVAIPDVANRLPVVIKATNGVKKLAGATPLLVHAVSDDGSEPRLLMEKDLRARPNTVTETFDLDPELTLRISIGTDRVIDLPPELWRPTWNRVIVTFSDEAVSAKLRVPAGDHLEWQTVSVPYAPGSDGAGV